MKLISFSVENYRSIVRAHQLRLDTPVTVLIGPNNEGKSNILRALVTAMKALPRVARPAPIRTSSFMARLRSGRETFKRPAHSVFRDYDWERDFPIHQQDEEPGRHSVFRLVFGLSRGEHKQFENVIKRNLLGNLVLEFRVGKSECEVLVADSDSSNILTQDLARDICGFLGKRFG